MSGRHLGAILTLGSVVGTSALGAAGALHVDLEHRARTDASAHVHHPTEEGLSHPHGPDASVPGHAHADPDGLRHGDAPEHEHVLLLAAELQARPGRGVGSSLSSEPADAPENLTPGMRTPPPRSLARAGPGARAAPLSRRSVILQV